MPIRYFANERLLLLSFTDRIKVPELYMAANPQFGSNSVCDCCSLKADCKALFSERGKECKSIMKKKCWQIMPSELINEITSLNTGLEYPDAKVS